MVAIEHYQHYLLDSPQRESSGLGLTPVFEQHVQTAAVGAHVSCRSHTASQSSAVTYGWTLGVTSGTKGSSLRI